MQILNGRALTLGRPEYPQDAAIRRLEGTVIVQVEIDEAGNVIAASDMCQGPPYLSEAAVRGSLEITLLADQDFGRTYKGQGCHPIQLRP